MKVSRVAEMRALDRRAFETYGIPEELLMENAGLAVYRVLDREFGIPGKTFVVCCGVGNNGGDGLVIARQLHANGARVKVYVFGDVSKFGGAAQLNLAHCVPFTRRPDYRGGVARPATGHRTVRRYCGRPLWHRPQRGRWMACTVRSSNRSTPVGSLCSVSISLPGCMARLGRSWELPCGRTIPSPLVCQNPATCSSLAMSAGQTLRVSHLIPARDVYGPDLQTGHQPSAAPAPAEPHGT